MGYKCICCSAPAVVRLAEPGSKAAEDYCKECAIYMVNALSAAADA